MNKFISRYFSANQQRLELLYIAFRKHKTRDPMKARHLFSLFWAGLEQHINWNQKLLLPVLHAQADPELKNMIDKATEEQQQLLSQVKWLSELTLNQLESHGDEQRLEYQLSDHFENQEFTLYVACDRLFDTDTVTSLLEQLSATTP